MATPTKPKIRLKLLLDINSRTVVFAEARKDFVDFLFGMLELPLGSILELLRSYGMAGSGSWAKVYDSVRNLDEEYMLSSKTKKSLLKPKIAASSETNPTPLLKHMAYPYHESGYGSPCSSGMKGHVKGAVTYMVMDDLTVKPLSTISSISLLNKMGIQNYGSLHEMTVEVDMFKGLELVKASFDSTKVLTDVFFPTSASSSKRQRNA